MDRPEDDAAALARLLDARNEHPESLREIDAEIWRRFGRTRAVLVLDMCGFSRLTMRYGITHFLAMIRRLGTIVRPVIAEAGGRVVKTDADNVFATFDDVPAALEAARAIQAHLDQANIFLPEDWDLHAGIGIGYGPLLLIGDDDLFGAEMNVASKLGEDVAGRGEILLSAAARERLGDAPGVALEPIVIELSASGSKLSSFAEYYRPSLSRPERSEPMTRFSPVLRLCGRVRCSRLLERGSTATLPERAAATTAPAAPARPAARARRAPPARPAPRVRPAPQAQPAARAPPARGHHRQRGHDRQRGHNRQRGTTGGGTPAGRRRGRHDGRGGTWRNDRRGGTTASGQRRARRRAAAARPARPAQRAGRGLCAGADEPGVHRRNIPAEQHLRGHQHFAGARLDRRSDRDDELRDRLADMRNNLVHWAIWDIPAASDRCRRCSRRTRCWPAPPARGRSASTAPRATASPVPARGRNAAHVPVHDLRGQRRVAVEPDDHLDRRRGEDAGHGRLARDRAP